MTLHLDLSEFSRMAEQTALAAEALETEMYGTMEEAANALLPAVVAGTPRNTSALAQGLYAGVEGGPAQGQVTGFIAVQGPAQRYVWPVETGAAAHWPPKDAIELWVAQKQRGGDLQWTTTRVNKDGSTKTAPMTVRSIAFLIARAIARRGTIKRFGYGGAEMGAKALAAGRNNIDRIVSRRLVEFMARVLGK